MARAQRAAGAAVAQLQHAARDQRAAAVGVIIGEHQRTGASLGEIAAAAKRGGQHLHIAGIGNVEARTVGDAVPVDRQAVHVDAGTEHLQQAAGQRDRGARAADVRETGDAERAVADHRAAGVLVVAEQHERAGRALVQGHATRQVGANDARAAIERKHADLFERAVLHDAALERDEVGRLLRAAAEVQRAGRDDDADVGGEGVVARRQQQFAATHFVGARAGGRGGDGPHTIVLLDQRRNIYACSILENTIDRTSPQTSQVQGTRVCVRCEVAVQGQGAAAHTDQRAAAATGQGEVAVDDVVAREVGNRRIGRARLAGDERKIVAQLDGAFAAIQSQRRIIVGILINGDALIADAQRQRVLDDHRAIDHRDIAAEAIGAAKHDHAARGRVAACTQGQRLVGEAGNRTGQVQDAAGAQALDLRVGLQHDRVGQRGVDAVGEHAAVHHQRARAEHVVAAQDKRARRVGGAAGIGALAGERHRGGAGLEHGEGAAAFRDHAAHGPVGGHI